MKRKTHVLRIVLSFIALIVSMALMEKGSSADDGIKIAYVDLKVILNESDAGKKAKAELESLIKTKQAAIDEKGKSIEKLKGEFEKQASVLSPEAKKSKEEEIERLLRDYQRLVQDSQGELKKREDKYTESIIREIRDIIDKIGKEEGYSLILENVEGIILYSKKDLDITEKVIKRYNELKPKEKEKK